MTDYHKICYIIKIISNLSLNFKLIIKKINNKKINHIKLRKYKMLKQNYQNSSTTVPSTGSLALPLSYQQLFKFCNTLAFKVSQLISGIKLAKVINKIFFDNNNFVLNNKIISQDQQKKGNNVINFNIILKQIKNNTKFNCPQAVKQLTPFKLINSEQQMLKFVEWLVACWKNNHSNVTQDIQQRKQNVQKNIGSYRKLENAEYIIKNKKNLNSSKNAFQFYKDEDQIKYQNEYELKIFNNGQEQNIFQNVYFLDRDLSPAKQDIHINDSLDMSEKVSKKGSFKVIKPKTNFDDSKKQVNSDNKRIDQIDSPNKNFKQEQNVGSVIKNSTMSTQNFQRYYSDQKQSPSRKTVPKFAQRPPMYRKLNKQQAKIQIQNKNQNLQQNINQPQPFLIQSHSSDLKKSQIYIKKQKSLEKSKNQSLINQISRIDEQIKRQICQQISKIKQNQTRFKIIPFSPENLNNKTKSNRKLFKIDIKQVDQVERKSIISWLIGISLLNSMATNYFDRFHQICKNGIIFPQIINHYKGRSGQFAYFKNPIKPAEIHSNFQKVFSYLKQLPNFESQLLFMYDYFVPQALQNAFWSLLKSCQVCFQKLNSSKSKVFNRDSSIKQKLRTKEHSQIQSRLKTQRYQNTSQSLKKSTSYATSDYEKIKYGRSNKFKSNYKNNKNDIAKQTSVQKDQQKNKRKSSLDFIKQLPQKINNFKHQQLIQAQQPIQINKINKGYKELHELKKSHNSNSFLNTPQKKTDNSMSKSRIVSTNSVKKLQQKPPIPSITLQMQMKAIKYLKQKNHLNFQSMEVLSLFDDPIRNGVLFNKIIAQKIKIVYKYNHRPKNIIDCRQNFKIGLMQLKQSFVLIPLAYDFYFQEIIKGQLAIFYGLIWHILIFGQNKGISNLGPNSLKNQSAILNISRNNNYFDNQANQKIHSEILFWIRDLQQQSPSIAELQIRDFNSLSANITSNNLLYKIATAIIPQKYTLKPTYQQPINQLQQQSNIKKILSFYTHNKILKSQLSWKSKSLVKHEKSTTIEVMKNLMSYAKNLKKPILYLQSQNPVISFVKFARPNERDDIKALERNNERLQTTMANNSFAVPTAVKKDNNRKNSKKQIAEVNIEIPWMRNLGFTGDLCLNNGVILCRLISKLTMQTLNFNQNPTSKAECLTNIRKSLKLIDKFKWDEEDIASADEKTTLQIYKFIKQKYKHSYALKQINQIITNAKVVNDKFSV